MCGYIDTDVLNNKIAVCNLATTTAQQCADAGKELCQAERLGDVIICTSIKTDNHVNFVGTCSKDENRHGGARGTNFPCNIQTVHIGKT